jgi:hypothetical protein
MRANASKPCEVCGTEMRAAPSTLANRRTCGPECLARLLRARAPARACIECGQACPSRQRQTCSEACRAAVVGRSSTLGVRSATKRASRRKALKTRFKGKDKAQVIERLTREQGGRCKVCGGEGAALGDGRTGLVLDHCHVTGKARAMLCGPCNAALGLLKESPERIEALLTCARWVGQ